MDLIKKYKKVILFDGVCNLCNGFVQFVIKRDVEKKFVFVPLQSERGREMLRHRGLSAEKFDTVVLISEGNYYFRSSAALRVVKELGGLWSILYVFIIVPSFIRDAVYRLISRFRYKIFGKREQCMVPDEGIKNRFLD